MAPRSTFLGSFPRIPALALLVGCLVGSTVWARARHSRRLSSRRVPAPEYPVLPYKTQGFDPGPEARSPDGRVALSECVHPMVLIGNLEIDHDKGGLFGRERSEAISFDGIPVEAPGYFRLLRAEDGIGTSRGPGGILGLKDPYLVRGELLTHAYKEDRPAWVTPGLEYSQRFSAGEIRRFPFVRLSMNPDQYLRHLQGLPARLTVALENPTDIPIPEITLTLEAEPKFGNFPLERLLGEDPRYSFRKERGIHLGPLESTSFALEIPGKPPEESYREAHRVVLSGARWGYPRHRADHPVRANYAGAGQDLQAFLPRRRIAIGSGEVPQCRQEGNLAVRYLRDFQSFGVELDGLDLEILAGWEREKEARFLRRLESQRHRLRPTLVPLLKAVLRAKHERIPVQRRPGAFDEFDAMALYLWGSISNPKEGHRGFSDQEDQWEKPLDPMYRHDGNQLPPEQRQELRDRIQAKLGTHRLRGLGAQDRDVERYSESDLELSKETHDRLYQPKNDWVGTHSKASFARRLRQERSQRWEQENRNYGFRKLDRLPASRDPNCPAPGTTAGSSSGTSPKAVEPQAREPSRPTPPQPAREERRPPPPEPPPPADEVDPFSLPPEPPPPTPAEEITDPFAGESTGKAPGDAVFDDFESPTPDPGLGAGGDDFGFEEPAPSPSPSPDDGFGDFGSEASGSDSGSNSGSASDSDFGDFGSDSQDSAPPPSNDGDGFGDFEDF